MEALTRNRFHESFARTKAKISAGVIVVILVAFAFGMHGGTPIEHGDNLAPKAKRTVYNFGNPRFFTYPGLMIYMNASVYIVYELFLKILPDPLHKKLDEWPYRDIPGHLLTLLFSIIGALSVYGICLILTKSHLISTAGSLLLVTSPLWNANAHYITVDIPLSALCALTAFILLKIVEGKNEISVRHMVVLGALAGLAASAKYNGAVIAMVIVAAMAFRIRPPVRSIRLLAVCGIATMGTFFLTNPFILISFREFVQDFLYAANLVAIGHPGFTVLKFHHHFSESLKLGWNVAPILLSLLGLVGFAVSGRIKIYSKIAILGFPIIYAVILLRTKMTFHRYALPMLPFLAVLAAFALFLTGNFIKSRFHGYPSWIPIPMLFAVVTLIAGVNAVQSFHHNTVMQKVDTRVILGTVFSANNHKIANLKIGAGNYCMNFLGIPAKKEKLSWVRDSDAEVKNDFDIIVLDSFTHDRYVTDDNMQLQIDFAGFANGRLITLSPYDKIKSAVPFSPMSMYSPHYPDLPFRKLPGPYIEVYINDPQLAQEIHQTLNGSRIQSILEDIKHGYYFGMFSKSESEDGRKMLSGKAKEINRRFSELFERRKKRQL